MSCRSGRSGRVGIHHMGSDRASRRTLIALGGEPPRCGVASKVLATWCCRRQRLYGSGLALVLLKVNSILGRLLRQSVALEDLGGRWFPMAGWSFVGFQCEPTRAGMRSLPARVGLAEKAPRARLVTATVATSVAMLQARYYAGCRRCRRCRQINHHSIWEVIFGYRRRPVSAHRIGTTLQFLVPLMAAIDRLPVAAFWMCSLHQSII